MRKYNFILFAFFLIFISSNGFSKDFTKEIEIYIETYPKLDNVKDTTVDLKGKFEFSKLRKGRYLLKMLVKEDRSYREELRRSKKKASQLKEGYQAFYNDEDQLFYVASKAGCVQIKFSKFSNIELDQIKFQYRNEILGMRELITIGEFHVLESQKKIKIFDKWGKFKGAMKSISLSKFLKTRKKFIS